jgi:CRISPR type III-A-associated RAMP protein Csm4
MSLIEVKLRPTGPWRVGDRAGDRERVDVVYHSDALYSAVAHAMRALGWLEEWLEATARAAGDPAVRFSSLFPFMGKTRLVAPPASVWPPANPGKLYLHAAKLVPLEILKSGVVEESRWQVDGESGCMLPMGVSAPFHVSLRSAAAVDRVTGATEPHRIACLEFASNAGFWGVFEVTDAGWEARVKSALRLLADSGFGGERSRGWGRSAEPQFSEAAHLFAPNGAEGLLWLLSLYSPHETDAVDWSRGEYAAVVRGGWTESASGTAAKKQVRMIAEGSVLAAASVRGQAVDVSPDGFAHPVYRAGFALALPVPTEILVRAVETVARPVKPALVVPAPAPESHAEQATQPGEEPAPEASVPEALIEELGAPVADLAEPQTEQPTEPDVEASRPSDAGEPAPESHPEQPAQPAEEPALEASVPGVSIEELGAPVADLAEPRPEQPTEPDVEASAPSDAGEPAPESHPEQAAQPAEEPAPEASVPEVLIEELGAPVADLAEPVTPAAGEPAPEAQPEQPAEPSAEPPVELPVEAPVEPPVPEVTPGTPAETPELPAKPEEPAE